MRLDFSFSHTLISSTIKQAYAFQRISDLSQHEPAMTVVTAESNSSSPHDLINHFAPTPSSLLLSTLSLDPFLNDDNNNIIETEATTQQTHQGSIFDVQVLVLTAIFIAIVAGNLPVVITIIFGRLGKTRMYYFLLHLCFADLITGCFSVIPQLAWELTRHFHGGNILCKIVKYFQILGPYLSSYTLTVMSIDRFLAICYPLTNNHLSLHRAKMSIAVAWFFSLLFCVPQAIIFSYIAINTEGTMECWATFPFQPWGERVYVTWYAVSVFIVPFFIIFFTHFRICCELWKTSKERRLTMRKGVGRGGCGGLLIPPSADSTSRGKRGLKTRRGTDVDCCRDDEDEEEGEGKRRRSRITFPSFRSANKASRSKKTLSPGTKSTMTATTTTLTSTGTANAPNATNTSMGENAETSFPLSPPASVETNENHCQNADIHNNNPYSTYRDSMNINRQDNQNVPHESIHGHDHVIQQQESRPLPSPSATPLPSCLKSSIKSPPSCTSPPPPHVNLPSSLSTSSTHSKRNSVEFVHLQRIDGSDLIPETKAESEVKERGGRLHFARRSEGGLVGGTDDDTGSPRAVNRCSSQEEEHLRAKIKSVKLTVTVILCYVFCSLPFICVQLWAYWYPGAQESDYWTGQYSVFFATNSFNERGCACYFLSW